MNILSIIDSITRGTDKKGKKFWNISLASGDTLFCWDWNRIADIKVNEEADFTVQAKGDFLHVLSALPVLQGEGEEKVPFDEDSTSDTPAPEKPIETPQRSYGSDRNKETRTQALTKAACAAINGVPFEVFLGMAAGDKEEALAIYTAAIISMVETFEDKLF